MSFEAQREVIKISGKELSGGRAQPVDPCRFQHTTLRRTVLGGCAYRKLVRTLIYVMGLARSREKGCKDSNPVKEAAGKPNMPSGRASLLTSGLEQGSRSQSRNDTLPTA